MKKKIAILLAASMMIPTFSLSAASENTLSAGSIIAVPGTVVFEEGGMSTGVTNLFPDKDPADNEKIINYVSGTSVNIKVRSDENVGATFKVILENAGWFFRNNRTDIDATNDQLAAIAKLLILNTDVTKGGASVALTDSLDDPDVLSFGAIKGNAFTANFKKELTDMVSGITIVNPTTLNAILSGTAVLGTDYTVTGNDSIPREASDLNSEGGQRLLSKATVNYGSPAGINPSGTVSTYNTNKGIYFPNSRTYVNFDGDEVAYAMTVSSNNYTGTLTLHKALDAEDSIKIPLVSRVEEEGDVRVAVGVEGNLTVVSQTTLKFGEASKASTDTSVLEKEKITSKYIFSIPTIYVKEKIAGSLQKGKILLYAPYGYTFVDPAQKFNETREGFNYPYVRAASTLSFTGGVQDMENTPGNRFISYYVDSSGKTQTDVIVIDTNITGLIPTSKTNGVLEISGLQLTAQEYAPLNQSVSLKIEGTEGTGITTQEFVIGTRSDWNIVLELAKNSTVTNLVNGRYIESTTGTSFDTEHKTARVRFSEKIVASWWALRETEFSLPEGVKFRKVTFLNEENLDHTNNNFKLNGDYLPSASKTNYVQLSATKLKITDLAIQRDKTAAFEMDIWVSIESGFEGDITLTPSGSDYFEGIAPLVIAKAVSPITIKTEVKNVKIGYQWQEVADIQITETAAGMLKKDKTVELFIDDDISNDNIAIAPDFTVELNTTTKLRFSRPTTNSGKINFSIEIPSYGSGADDAATIKFSNIIVKIDRTVPETNNRPYKIVAGGTAIAENYSNNITSVTPKFPIKGIGADFLNVVTPAEGTNNNTLRSLVRVTIGSNELSIGKEPNIEKIIMDTSAYISAESNSTMIPLRFVAEAFGLSSSQVQWDNDERTVTILNGATVVQFKIGSSDLIINGVKTTMYSLDATPLKVKAEIKDNRSFLPLRALGTAFGIEVGWDAATKTAILNADLLEETAGTQATETQTTETETTDSSK